MLKRCTLISTSMLLLSACGQSVPPNNATSCFNPELYQAGNQYLTVIMEDGKPKAPTLVKLTKDDTQPYPAGKESRLMHVAMGSISTVLTNRVFSIDAANYRYALLSEDYQIDTFTTKMRADKHTASIIDFNFDTPNQSHSRDVSYDIEYINADDATANQTTTQHSKVTTTFVGIESITTPAGEFDTCRMQTTLTDAEGKHGQETTTWYAQRLGIPVKITSTIDERAPMETVLIQATINGKTFTPTPADIVKRQLADALAFAK